LAIELPIPEILERILKNKENKEDEESIVEKSRKMIYDNPRQYDNHLRLINDSLVFIEFICLRRSHQDEDELVLRGIGNSLYNDCATAWLLMMEGYYQISFMSQRHMLECSILLEYFTQVRSAIQEWKGASRALRKRKFFPGPLLPLVKGISGVEEHIIEASYALLCDMNVHPTYTGIARMLGDNKGMLNWGPFVSPQNLRNALTWLGRISAYAAKQLILAFEEDNLKHTIPEFKKALEKFDSNHSAWIKRYRDFPTFEALREEGHDL